VFSKKLKMEERPTLKEILPKTGLVYSERGALTEILCKPKIMPIKSAVLEQLAKIEGEREAVNNEEGPEA
jgi:BBSome-interacting protein 1